MPEEKPDHASLAAARVSAFAEYTPDLHRFLRRHFARNGAELQDLMQDVAKAYLAIPRDTVIRDPLKYLFGIARNIGCRHLSSRAREPLDCRTAATPESLGHASIDSAEIDAVSHDLVKQIRQLPRVYQEVLRLRMETDLTIKEISEELQLSEPTVKKYLVKARAHLQMSGK